MSIREVRDKIKSQLDGEGKHRIFVLLALLLTASAAFGLGRISVSSGHAPIAVGHYESLSAAMTDASVPAATPAAPASAAAEAGAKPVSRPAAAASSPGAAHSAGSVFASKTGTRYYPQGCKAGNRVSEANKIWFSSPSEAEKLGLSLGVGC